MKERTFAVGLALTLLTLAGSVDNSTPSTLSSPHIFDDLGHLEITNVTGAANQTHGFWSFDVKDPDYNLHQVWWQGRINHTWSYQEPQVTIVVPCPDLPSDGRLGATAGPNGTVRSFQVPIRLGTCEDPSAAEIPIRQGESEINNTYEADPSEYTQQGFSVLANDFSFTVTVKDADGDVLRNVRVLLYDRDAGGSQVYLAAGYTDDNGQYTFTVDCIQDGPGPTQNIDPTIKVALEHYGKLRVEDSSGTRYGKSVNYGSDLSCSHWFTSIAPPTSADDEYAWDVWDEVMDSVDRAELYLGSNKVTYRTPTSATTGFYTASANRVSLSGTASDQTMHHEYGHFVDDMARGDVSSIPGGGPHESCNDGAQDVGLAMTEGFAHFWASLESWRWKNNCSPRLGAENEADVFQILYDICDGPTSPEPCNRQTNEVGDTVYEANALAIFLDTLARGPDSLYDWKSDYDVAGGEVRDFVISAVHNGMTTLADGTTPLNDDPVLSSWVEPASGTWYDASVPISVIIDDDTLMPTTTFLVKPASTCLGSNSGSFQTSYWYRGTMWAPSGIEDSSVKICYFIQDELGANTGWQESPYTFKLDSKAPTSQATNPSSGLVAATWSISWSASDGGSGIDRVEIHQLDPLGEWTLVDTKYSTGGTYSSGLLDVLIPGEYCYGTVAYDEVGNKENGPYADTCVTTPVNL